MFLEFPKKISQVGTRQAVNERLGRLLSHVAFPCSNFLAEIPSGPLFLKLFVDSGDTNAVVL